MTVSLFLRLLLLLSALPGCYCAHLVGTHNYNHSLASTPTRGDEVLLAGSARKLWLCSLGLLRKLGGSGSPGQLLQQQQTKIVQSLGSGGAKRKGKPKESQDVVVAAAAGG